MRKEYNNRWNAPLVNPPITHGEYEALRAIKKVSQSVQDAKLADDSEAMLIARDAEQAAYFEQIRLRSISNKGVNK